LRVIINPMRFLSIIGAGLGLVLGGALSISDAQTLKRSWVAGSWIEVDCRGIPPKLILRVGKSKAAYLLDSMDALEVTGTGSDEPLELPCGAHKPTTVWIEYEQPSANQRGVKGLVRAIHFEPPPSGLKTR
jgi:hypothetical protein